MKLLKVALAFAAGAGFTFSTLGDSDTPCTCHWTGAAKNGNWMDAGNWAEGVVPGVYTALDAEGNVVTNGCRGSTAVFGRVPNDSLDSRRCIKANPYDFSAGAANRLHSIGHIVFDGTVDPDHPDRVLPEYVFSNSLTWQWGEPYLPLEGGGSIELTATVDKPVYFDSSLVLGAHETTSQTYHFINNSRTTVAFHRLTAMIGSVQWSKETSAWLANTIRCEGTGDIVLMASGTIPRSNQEYSWSLAMTGGRLLVRKAYNLGTKTYANISAQTFQLLVPAGVGQQVLDIEEGCSFGLNCDNSSIASVSSDLRVTGEGTFNVHSGTDANREFFVSDGATVEVACTLTNNTAGTFAGEKAGLNLKSSGGGTFFVSGRNALPGAVQLGAGVTYVAATVGNVGEQKELGAGERLQLDGGGVFKYTGEGEFSTKFIKAGGYAGDVWNAGAGDLFFAGMLGNYCDFKVTLTNDGVHAIGFTADVVNARPIVAPGSLVRFAPPPGASAAAIDVTNMIVSANAAIEIADGTDVRIHALYQGKTSDTVDIRMNAAGGARLVIDNLTGFNNPSAPGVAPAWIRVNGRPARFTDAHELVDLAGDDLAIAARGDVVPNAPTKTVAITAPGDGEKDTLAADATGVVLLRNRERIAVPVVELGAGQVLTAPFIDCADAATPIVFTGPGAFGGTFSLLGGTLIRSNETAGVALSVTAREADVTLTGRPDPDDASFAVALARGAATVSTAGAFALDSLRVDDGARVTLQDAAFTGRVAVARADGATAALVQNGGAIWTSQAGQSIVGGQGHGYYELNGGRIVNYAGGGSVYVGYRGTTVFTQQGGEIHITNGTFQVRARDGGYSVFYQKAGLLWQTTSGADLYASGAGNDGAAAWIIDGPDAISRVWTSTGGRNFVLGGSHTSTTADCCDYVLAVNNGGTIHAGSIVATRNHQAKTRALVSFNGGVFRNNYAYGRVFGETGGAWFDPVDRVVLFEKGLTMQADVSCSTTVPLEAPTGKGVASIAWTDSETTFVGAPAVRIVGAGFGATAVADYDSTTRKVRGIVVTSPGCDYGEGTVAEILYGNDGLAAKVVATLPCTLADNVSGGFTMKGYGGFTFFATNTYTGATVVEKGTLTLGADDVIDPRSDLVLNGGTLDLKNRHQVFASVCCNGGKVANGKVEARGLVVDFDEVTANRPLRVDLGICTLPANVKPVFRNFDASKLSETGKRYTLMEFKGGVLPEGLDLSEIAAALPPGWGLRQIGGLVKLSYRRALVFMVGYTPGSSIEEDRPVRVSETFGYDPVNATEYLERALDSGCRTIIIDRQAGPWYTEPLLVEGAVDKEIVFEDGAELCALREGDAYRNPYSSKLMTFNHCTNIVIRGNGFLRMWREDYAARQPPYENDPPSTQYRHALSFGACAHVTIDGLTISETGGDGIGVGPTVSGAGDVCTDFTIRNVTCTRNYRQGISVTGVDGLLIEDSRFERTGEVYGTAPMAGIDFEPSDARDRVANCVVRRCVFADNRGGGVDAFLEQLPREITNATILVEDCDIYGNGATVRNYQSRVCNPGGGVFYGARGYVRFENVRVTEADGTTKVLTCERTFGPRDGETYPPTVDTFDFAAATVVDAKPGETVALNAGRVRGRAVRVTFYAPRAGAVSISCQQERGWQCDLVTTPMRLENATGEAIGEVAFPSVAGNVLPITVPAAGFYTLVADTKTSLLVFTASDVPIAYDNLPQPIPLKSYSRAWSFLTQNRNMVGEFWVAAPAAATGLALAQVTQSSVTPIEYVDRGGGAHLRLTDPDGTVVWDMNAPELEDVFSVPLAQMKAGLWNVRFEPPTGGKGTYYMFALDAAGVAPFYFLSKDKYWR